MSWVVWRVLPSPPHTPHLPFSNRAEEALSLLHEALRVCYYRDKQSINKFTVSKVRTPLLRACSVERGQAKGRGACAALRLLLLVIPPPPPISSSSPVLLVSVP